MQEQEIIWWCPRCNKLNNDDPYDRNCIGGCGYTIDEEIDTRFGCKCLECQYQYNTYKIGENNVCLRCNIKIENKNFAV